MIARTLLRHSPARHIHIPSSSREDPVHSRFVEPLRAVGLDCVEAADTAHLAAQSLRGMCLHRTSTRALEGSARGTAKSAHQSS
jgi:hypothetical protein